MCYWQNIIIIIIIIIEFIYAVVTSDAPENPPAIEELTDLKLMSLA